MSKEPGRRSAKRIPKRTVLEQRKFKPPPGYKESEKMPGVHMSAAYMAFMREQLGQKVAAVQHADELSPEVRALADELRTIHLPEFQLGGQKYEPTKVTVFYPERIAHYLIEDRGYPGQDPDREHRRWVPTPNAGLADMGIHITRNPDGTWPIPDPEDFYDADKVTVTRSENGWIASHPCGAKAEAPSKAKAHADVLAQLVDLIEAAKADNEAQAEESEATE